MSWLFGYLEKWFLEKAEVNFKVDGAANWEQIITMHLLPNISRSKDNPAMMFGHLKDLKWEIVFFKNLAEYEEESLIPDFFYVFFLNLYVCSTLVLIYFGRPPLPHTIKKIL